ncbi:hypothetical protein BCR44DRAFT_1015167 [Catenaria anguillulae PL171]|uniref:F-box domain-containing protein n=1 Tax=Catenaria anguillulae PL171 TaxID=765915 RepID=A0A1Y2HU12_9FUNG|nr:hypothetical protein BCR44DRAFT_1015167 [Catenaria anguillulae PL171]
MTTTMASIPTTPPLCDLTNRDQDTGKTPTRLLDVPFDLLLQITRLLPIKDALSFALVCHQLYSPAAHRIFSEPYVQSTQILDRLLASLAIANQHASKHSEARTLVRHVSLSLRVAQLDCNQLERLVAACPRLHSVSIRDVATAHHWAPPSPGHSGPLATLKIESLLSLVPQLTHLSLSQIDPLDTPHLITHVATHCKHLSSLTLNQCVTLPNDALTWQSSILALHKLAPHLKSLAIHVDSGARTARTTQEALAIVLRDFHCPSLRALKLAAYKFVIGSLEQQDVAAGLLAGLLTRHPALVRLHLEQFVSFDIVDWVKDGIIAAWKVPQGVRGPRRKVVVDREVKREVKARIKQACDGVVVEVAH